MLEGMTCMPYTHTAFGWEQRLARVGEVLSWHVLGFWEKQKAQARSKPRHVWVEDMVPTLHHAWLWQARSQHPPTPPATCLHNPSCLLLSIFWKYEVRWDTCVVKF